MIYAKFAILLLTLVRAQEEITTSTIESSRLQKDRCGREYFCMRFDLFRYAFLILYSFECEFGSPLCPSVAWKEKEGSDFVTVKLIYNSPDASYVAIGFSRDDKMGQDDIYFCQKNEQNGIAIVSSYSTGMSQPVNVNPETSKSTDICSLLIVYSKD